MELAAIAVALALGSAPQDYGFQNGVWRVVSEDPSGRIDAVFVSNDPSERQGEMTLLITFPARNSAEYLRRGAGPIRQAFAVYGYDCDVPNAAPDPAVEILCGRASEAYPVVQGDTSQVLELLRARSDTLGE